MKNINGEPGCKGRGNIAPVTINLPRIGILAKGDKEEFFNILGDRLSIARESLLHRYSVLKNLKIKDLPFVAGQGLMKGSEGLGPEDGARGNFKTRNMGNRIYRSSRSFSSFNRKASW